MLKLCCKLYAKQESLIYKSGQQLLVFTQCFSVFPSAIYYKCFLNIFRLVQNLIKQYRCVTFLFLGVVIDNQSNQDVEQLRMLTSIFFTINMTLSVLSICLIQAKVFEE